MTPEISILIPVYKVEQYVTQCLNSLILDPMINQCEIIICNDCTPDNSMEKVLDVIKKNMGLGATRNTGFDNAKGKYIICTDSDDWVEPNYLTNMYQAAEKNKADITTCNLIKNYSNQRIKTIHNLDSDSITNIKKLISTKLPGYLHCKLLRRSVIVENKISFDNELIISEDMLFILKLLFHTNNFCNTNQPLYNYRVISNHSDFSEADALERIKCNTKIEEVLKQNNQYDSYKTNLAFRKIFTLIKAFSNAPYKICHKYYQYFSGQTKLIKISNLKTFIYKVIAFSIDTKQVFLTDLIVSFFKVKRFLNNKRLKKI